MRRAVAPFENEGGQGLAHILPFMTQPSSLTSKGSFVPTWNEDILVNEPLQNLLNPQVIIFFEIVDFGARVDLEQHPSGFFPIAWAFLKPVSYGGTINHGTIRLQLHHYNYSTTRLAPQGRRPRRGQRSRKDNIPDVWYDWVYQRNTGKQLYPSTIYVSLRGARPPAMEIVRGVRPTLPTHEEIGKVEFRHMRRAREAAVGKSKKVMDFHTLTEAEKRTIYRKRRPTEECRIPSAPLHHIPCGTNGCFALKWSPDGKTLAAACAESLIFTVKLYDTETGNRLFTFPAHHELVYDISWSHDGRQLVSASSDNTAKVWAVDTSSVDALARMSTTPTALLQHACFVYCAQFHPRDRSPPIVLTGAFDGITAFSRPFSVHGHIHYVI